MIGREAPCVLGRQRAEIGEDHLCGTRDRERTAVALPVALLAGLLPDAIGVRDQLVQLIVGLVAVPRLHEPHVDRGVAAIGDDLQENVVTLLGPARASLDLVDPSRQFLLVRTEGVAGVRRDKPTATALDAGQLQVTAQVVLQHHVGDGAEHVDQFGDVDELREAFDRLVIAGGLQLQLGARVAKGAGPRVELVDAAIPQQPLVLVAYKREHFAHRVGDRRSRSLDQRAARIDGLDEAAFYVEVPGALRTIRVHALQRRPVGRKCQLPEFLRLIDDDLIDAELLDSQHVITALAERFQLLGQFLLHRFEPLAGDAIVAIGAGNQVLEARDLRLDHLLLKGGRDGNKLEGRMSNDNGVPAGRSGTREEAGALVFGEVGLVGDEDAGGRVKLQEFAARLGKTVAWDDEDCLSYQAQSAFFHDGGGDRERLAAADRVRHVGRSRGDNAPDRPLLVVVEPDDVAGAGQRQVSAVEVTRHQVVEVVVVEPRQAVGAVGVGPNPLREGSLDLVEFLLGGFRGLRVEHAPFAAVHDLDVVDLRSGAVERVMQQLAGVAARRAPFRRALCAADEAARSDAPDGDLNRVEDLHLAVHHLAHEVPDDFGRQPGCAETRRDIRRRDVSRLHRLQGRDVAPILAVQLGGGFGGDELVADGAGQVGIRRLPLFGHRIAEHRAAELRERLVGFALQQFAEPLRLDEAQLVQRHRERVGRAGDHRQSRRRYDAFAEDRPHAGDVGVEVVIFDGGDQPAIRIVGEVRQVGAAMLFPLLAGLVVGQRRDDGVVDRPVIADESRVAGAQADLQLLPRLAGGLGSQHVAHSITDRHQAADDLGGFQADAVAGLAALDHDRDRLPADDLAQPSTVANVVAAFLDGGAVGGTADLDRRGERLRVLFEEGIQVAGEDARRQTGEGRIELRLQRAGIGMGAAGVGPARSINTTALPVLAQHHLGVRQEIRVHQHDAAARMPPVGLAFRSDLVAEHLQTVQVLQFRLRFGWLLAQFDLAQLRPGWAPGCLAFGPPLKHQHVDHDLGAGRRPHAALG